MKPLAIIPVYNEADVLPWTISHLHEQGCQVHLIDNWSTDGLIGYYRQCSWQNDRGDLEIELWPPSGPLPIYDWTGILMRIEEVAFANQGRWVILHDADEIRRTPGKDGSMDGGRGVTLADALQIVSCYGFNAVEYRVVTFKPIDNGYHGDPEKYFRHYTLDALDSGLPHVKTWFQGSERVDLHTHGGHQVLFAGRSVFPVPFVLKHYPIRSQEQGERKLWRDRLPRYSQAEKAMRWHEQYNGLKQGQSLISDPKDLLCVDREAIPA